MKNLGKIVLLLALCYSLASPSIRATVDARSVEQGEMVTYSLSISGKEMSRPIIQTLCGVDVISTSSQTSIEMLNGAVTRKNTFSYKFIPQKNCTIEPIEVEVDSLMQKSNAVEIKVGAVVANKDSDFSINLFTSKKELLVGEPFGVVLVIKQRIDAQAVDSKFVAPALKGFWIKGESQPKRTQDETHIYTKIIYSIAAQRVGDLKIEKAELRIASRTNTRDSWGGWSPRIKWKTYYSNELDISVKALPNGVELVGSFGLMAMVDKESINAGEAVNLTLQVLGDGNLEDIKSFKPYIDGVNIFEEKIVVEGNKLVQKITFVADNDFVIPTFSLRYFDPTSKEIKTTSTNEIAIKVKNAKPKESLVVKKQDKPALKESVVVKDSISKVWLVVTFIFGLVVGMLIMMLKPLAFKPRKKQLSLNDSKLLIIKLLPYKDDVEVQEMLDVLEESTYGDASISIDKKRLKKMVQKYKLV